MKKFMVIYKAPAGAWEQMAETSPEEAKKGMEAWMMWAKKCGKGLVDMGTPLGNGHKVMKSGGMSVEDGVTGYSVLQAKNMEAALDMLSGHPHLMQPSCEIEVYESLPLPGSNS